MKRAGNIGLHVLFYAAFAAPVWQRLDPVPAIALAALFIWISVVDIETFEIPDLAQILLLAVAALLVAQRPVDWREHVAAAVVWPALTWLVAEGYWRLRGREGLGLGDVKLMAGIGLLVGFVGATHVLAGAAIAGAAAILLRSFATGGAIGDLGPSSVAFGPFLCLSAWAVWLWGV